MKLELPDPMARPASISPLRYVVIFIVATVLVVYATFFRQYNQITSEQAAYAVMIITLGALPSLISLINKRENDLIPLMPLHGLFYALTFGIPALSNQTDWLGVGEADITDALLLTVFGLVFVYLGYFSFRKLFSRVRAMRTRNVLRRRQIKTAFILYSGYLALQFFPFLRTLPSVDQLSAPLGYLSLGILALLALDGKLSRLQLAFFIISTVGTLLITVLSGSLAPTVLLLVFLGILYWDVKKRISWNLVLISALITVLLNPVKQHYRDVTWYSEQSSLSYSDKAIVLFNTIREYYSDVDILLAISDDAGVVNRLAHVATFAHVINLTPSSVPYWSGYSYYTLWTSFIPRVLWPGKPQATIGQDFGHRYSLIGSADQWTSINLPWLVEFYVNFGTVGVLTGMFFIGVFFRFLVEKLKSPLSAPMDHVLAVTVVFGLFYAESNLSLMVGAIFSTYIFFALLLGLLTRGGNGASSNTNIQPMS